MFKDVFKVVDLNWFRENVICRIKEKNMLIKGKKC